MTKEQLSKVEIPGEVVDIKDPLKKGRIKVKVTTVYDKLDNSSIPWASPIKEPHGKSFKTPDVGQIVNVRFEDGDHYRPIYTYAEHHNINLQKKLDSLSDEDYINFTALYFDDNLQIYKDSEKMVIDYELSNITINKHGNMSHNLRDNSSFLTLGSHDAVQESMLGTHWLEWFDTFVQTMFIPFFGNSGAAVIPTPEMINVLNQYNALRQNFVSKHVFIVDNDAIKERERINEKVKGDKWKSTVKENDLTITYAEPYIPEPRPATGQPEMSEMSEGPPIDNLIIEAEDGGEIKRPAKMSGGYTNGKIPLNRLKKSKALSTNGKHTRTNISGHSTFLIAEAADAWDKLMVVYNKASFYGKHKLYFNDGYRTYEGQKATKAKYKGGAAGRWYVGDKRQGHSYVPKGIRGEYFKATSKHGLGLAVDISWGIKIKYRKKGYSNIREAAYRHPVYKWLALNGPKFGWYNPKALRDGVGPDEKRLDEWWHWEYTGIVGVQPVVHAPYGVPFSNRDIAAIKSKSDNVWKPIT